MRVAVSLAAAAALLLLSFAVSAEEHDDVHKCDEYAAHPNDPHRWAAGVADDDIIPGPAVKFCLEAVDDYPDTPRFQFQLGRALWAAHRFEEGTAVFLALEAASEYGPVYAYLGDAYLYGIGGVEIDDELAIALYQIADEEGFAPAGEVLAALSGAPLTEEISGGSATQQEVASAPATQAQETEAAQPTTFVPIATEPFDPNNFTQPAIVRGLANGNFSDMKVSGFGKTNYVGLDNIYLYLARFHGEFSGTYNFKDPSCIKLYSPQVEKLLQNKIMMTALGDAATTGLGSGQVPMQGFQVLGQVLMDMRDGGMGRIVEMEQQAAALGSSGAKDAAQLILTYGCQSEVVKRIYANIGAYVIGHEGIPSAEEAARREEVAAEEARQSEARRQRQLRADAEKSCVAQYRRESFCSCLVETMDELGVVEQEWLRLGNNFKDVLAIGKTYSGFPDRMRTCRTKT